MTRRLTVLFAALEALLVAAIGLAIPLVPLTIVWAAHFGFDPEWLVVWRAGVDVWLLGHGVDVTFTLDPELGRALAFPSAPEPVPVTIALLGFALLTVMLAARAGRRVAETGHRLLGGLAAVAVFAGLAVAVTATALHPMARPSLWQAGFLPALVFALGLVIGMLRVPGPLPPVLRDVGARFEDRLPGFLVVASGALRAGTAAVAIVVAASAALVAALFVTGFAGMIGMYQALHTEVVGGIALTVGQLAVLPNLVIWAASWLIGPGFAIGIGSQVSPVGTALGPIPALPVLAVVPPGDSPFGFAGILVPVVAGFFAGAAARRSLSRALGVLAPLHAVGVALGAGVTGGILTGLLAAASGGAAGPGRLQLVGPDPVLVGLVAGVEFAVAVGIGLAATVRMPTRRPRPGR